MAYDPINKIASSVVPLLADNIDTDQIIPARFLKATSRIADFGSKLFADWRYLPDGAPIPDFALNKFSRDAKILLAGDNFGCGSSREHAAWALYDYGFRVVIAKSFADIFKNNSLNNGLLVFTLPEDVHAHLLRQVFDDPDTIVDIDLPACRMSLREGEISYKFEINSFRSQCLQEGADLLDFLVARKSEIEQFEKNILLK